MIYEFIIHEAVQCSDDDVEGKRRLDHLLPHKEGVGINMKMRSVPILEENKFMMILIMKIMSKGSW